MSSGCISLTNQCSKSERVQFLKDDGVGGSVSLEYLGVEDGGGVMERKRVKVREIEKLVFSVILKTATRRHCLLHLFSNLSRFGCMRNIKT